MCVHVGQDGEDVEGIIFHSSGTQSSSEGVPPL